METELRQTEGRHTDSAGKVAHWGVTHGYVLRSRHEGKIELWHVGMVFGAYRRNESREFSASSHFPKCGGEFYIQHKSAVIKIAFKDQMCNGYSQE